MAEGKSGKPAVLIASNLNVWLGNQTGEDMNVQAQELFGFGVGAFEEKEVRALADFFEGPNHLAFWF